MNNFEQLKKTFDDIGISYFVSETSKDSATPTLIYSTHSRYNIIRNAIEAQTTHNSKFDEEAIIIKEDKIVLTTFDEGSEHIFYFLKESGVFLFNEISECINFSQYLSF